MAGPTAHIGLNGGVRRGRPDRTDVVDADTELVKLLDGLVGYISNCIEFLSANAYERCARLGRSAALTDSV